MTDADLTGDHFGLHYAKHGHVGTVTLNRPEVGNALASGMREPLRAIWRDLADDPNIRAVVVTGTGDRHFCTGVDLGEVSDTGQVTSGDGRAQDEIVWSPLNLGMWKPMICALNGLVAGGGLHFVADADIVLGVPAASIMDTHTSVGIVGAVENIGLTHRLPLGTVLRLTLCGRNWRLPAERAHQLGLLDEICAPEELLPTAMDIARSIAENSPRAVMLSKQAIWASIGRPREDALEYGWALARSHWRHPDFTEGPRAFAEQREPRWAP